MFPRVPAPLLNHLMWSTVLLLGLAIDRLARDGVELGLPSGK
jgi:hypothetical protein